MMNDGSVQNIKSIPQKYKEIYKTIWELHQKTLIDMAEERAWFIDQNQSLNLFIGDATVRKIISAHMYA